MNYFLFPFGMVCNSPIRYHTTFVRYRRVCGVFHTNIFYSLPFHFLVTRMIYTMGKSHEFMSLGKNISPSLAEIESMLWEAEDLFPNQPHDFPEEGVKAGLKIFMAVLLDRLWVMQEKEGMPIQQRLEMVEHYGNKVRKLFLEATDIDSHKLYENS